MNLRFFFLFLLVFNLLSCEGGKEKLAKGPSQERATPTSLQANMTIPLSVYTLEERNYEVKVELPGKTKSREQVMAVARVTGILKAMLAKEGTFVKKGQPLFQIERDIYEAEYESAKAAVQKAKADLEKASADWKRVSSAYQAKLVSDSEKDQAYSAYQVSLANLAQAKARFRQAEINLNYTVVRAEISGYLGKRLVDPGNLVQPGKELITIYSLSPLEVEFAIPERDLEKLGLLGNYGRVKNWPVEVKKEEISYVEKGKIEFAEAKLDETASLKVRALIPNNKLKFLPEQFVKVILTERKSGLLLPQRSVLFTPKGPIVYVIENGLANPREVSIEEVNKEYFVVKSGLKPGEVVALDNLLRLRPGVKVKPLAGEKR